jgi:NAD(P) transhydrogenase
METQKVDLAVIGAGPAGQKGAIQGAKAGMQVVVVDRLGLLGGSCLNHGTIPSKTLRRAILDMTGFVQSVYFGDEPRSAHNISVEDLRARISKVIEDENAVLQRQCEKNGIAIAFGTARFGEAPNTLEVLDSEGQVQQCIEADKFLIATGSRPRHPIDLPGDAELFVDSDLVFRLPRLPASLIVLGGGIIGCEYATMFAALGVEVTLMDRRDQLLRMLDGEIGATFGQYISHLGLKLRMGASIDQLRKGSDGLAEVVMADGETLRAECLFYSMGRVANVEGLQLEKAGVELDSQGNISANALFQTTNPHIYAAGDVIGPPALASTSMEQGRLAVRNALLLKSHHFPDFFPYGIYTIPEISSIGPTEQELRESGVHYEVGRAYYYEIARGPISGDTSGLIKLIFHAETLEVLAVHIIGTGATELIALGQMAIALRARVDYFVDNIFNYPTFAEGFRIAALNGLNKVEGSKAAMWV